MVDVDSLRQAPWLKTAAIGRVFAALASTGAVSRAVGGAVRNTLLGQAIDDVDIATTAPPEATLRAAAAFGLHAIPTGLQHGTVTLVADGVAYEVTTLRRDVTTDGRHAVVAFTDDWTLDAGRRDFTINALYCDPDGTLFDPLGGQADLLPTRVRFIGDARARIREDYLRILRFFRFSARYATGAVDAEGIAACGSERSGLARISAERIRVELLKLLVYPRAPDICRVMQAHGFLVALTGSAPSPLRLERLAAIEAAVGLQPDPLLRLAALVLTPGGDAGALARRLRLSGEERARLMAIAKGMAKEMAKEMAGVRRVAPLIDDHKLIYQRGIGTFRDSLLTAWAATPSAASDRTCHDRWAAATAWTPPKLPVTGQDVLAGGIPAGPHVGWLLAAVETWWMAHDFAPDRAACLTELRRQIAAGT